ncbi:MAG: phosphate ABC transporter permease PstA [Caldilineaceae bacterium]
MNLFIPDQPRHYRRRQWIDRMMRGATIAATLLALIPLFLILGHVLIVGGSTLNWDFFTQAYRAPVVGTDARSIQGAGGVAHGIIGTILITGVALLLSIPIGIMAAIYLAEYEDTMLSYVVRFCTDVLSAAPSIVVGVVGYIVIVMRYKQYSGFAGSVALTFLMVPTIVRTTEEILKLVPQSTREAAIAVGAPKWHVTLFVVLPTAASGILTGILLAFARGAGETAPLLLTAIGSNIISFNMSGEMAALPLLAYRYTGSPFPAEQALAWGAAFVLTVMVLMTNIVARWAIGGRQWGRHSNQVSWLDNGLRAVRRLFQRTESG